MSQLHAIIFSIAMGIAVILGGIQSDTTLILKEWCQYSRHGDLIKANAYSLSRQISVSTLRQAEPSAFSMH